MRTLSSLFVVCFFIGEGCCLVFLQSTVTLSLPADFPVGRTFYRMRLLDEASGDSPSDAVNFHLLKSVVFPSESKHGRGLFVIDEHTGSLMLSPHRKHSVADFKGSTFALDLVGVLSARPAEREAHATVILSIPSTPPDCAAREELCFSSAEVRLQVPETTKVGSRLLNLRPVPYARLCPGTKPKYGVTLNDFIEVSVDGDLKTKSSFDFQNATFHERNITCKIQSNDDDVHVFHALLRLFVVDVDDNPPYTQNSTKTVQEIDVSDVSPGKTLPVQLTVLDPDSPAVNKIVVSKEDPLNIFHLRDPILFHGVNGAHMLMNTALVPRTNFTFPDTSYNVSVIFNDTTLIDRNKTGNVTFYISISNNSRILPKTTFPPDEFQVVANVFRHSSHHARVIQPMEVQPHEGYFFRLLRDPSKDGIFGVTPVTGIVYVADEVALTKSTDSLHPLELSWTNRNMTDGRCSILVRVFDAGDPSHECGVEAGHRFPACARHGTPEECATSCGRGAGRGFCQWRSQASPNLVTEYATCSPHLQTCPDGTCDELEEMDPYLCPQDCASNVHGEAVPNGNGKGVAKSAAPCTCANANTCICAQFKAPQRKSRKPASRSQVKVSKDIYNAKSHQVDISEKSAGCGTQCTTMIVIVALVVSGLILAAGFVLYRRWSSHSKKDKLVTIRTPLNSSAQIVSREASNYPLQHCISGESRLNFPHDQLTLEETLGEGEFGKVVRGVAKNIANVPGNTTVAVKMLKDGSSSEKQDFVTELSLLKEISHPNVISLLGACTTDDGQLYLIMEFAENGSLLTYLRKLQLDITAVDGCQLISFALQISKGMEYLASMKIVHRDLAARNVLIAAGETLKISDFGLSRDVYERDTYLRKSQGKIPIKWMAIESLQSQIYTTKSDVWSYGVLLWEIMTLGNCPYPGVPTEKLFQMLKEGYRMEKPENCPSQIYDIMKNCWMEKPKSRPQFKEIVSRIDVILKDLTPTVVVCDGKKKNFRKSTHGKGEGSVLHQLASFPKLSVQQLGPYENQCLLMPSTEFNV